MRQVARDGFILVAFPGDENMETFLTFFSGIQKARPGAAELRELIERLYAGDAQAREALLDWALDRIFLKVRTELGRFGQEVWQDVTQKIVFDLLRYLSQKKFDPTSGNLPALVHGFVKTGITKFLAKSHKQRQREVPLEQLEGSPAKAVWDKIRLDFLAFNDETNRLESLFEICLKKLRRELATVLSLRYWRDLQMQDIAEQLGLPHTQKAIDLHRQALKEIKSCVARYRAA